MALLNQLLLGGDQAALSTLVQNALAGALGSAPPTPTPANEQRLEKQRQADAKLAEKARVAATKEAAKAAAKAEKEQAKQEQETKKQNASILTLAVKSKVMLESTVDSLKLAGADLLAHAAPEKVAEPIKEATKLIGGMLKECNAAVAAGKKKKAISPLSFDAKSLPKVVKQAKDALQKLEQYKNL